jgi:uncharacterized protein
VARKGKAVNRRKKSSPGKGGKPLLALLLVAVLIVAAFILLEHFRVSSKPKAVVTEEKPVQHLRIPPHTLVQQRLSSPAAPVAAPAPAEKPALPAAVMERMKGPGRLAIIVDDMGASTQELQSLLSIKIPVTFSVIPSLAHAKGVAEGAHGAGYEVMVHMPMEPEGYPKQPMEKIGLLVAMENAEIAERVNGYFASVPYAVGANNHMGSRFTQNAEKMEVVLKVLKGKGVFFVDSKTSATSVGYKTARGMGMKCASRQVFLDNVQDEGAVGKQLEQAAAVARKKGEAIAIGHPHPATIRALKKMMPELQKSGITFVSASALTR